MPELASTGVTLAVRVTGWPNSEGLGTDVRTVVVAVVDEDTSISRYKLELVGPDSVTGPNPELVTFVIWA